jgi:hypothetical protein
MTAKTKWKTETHSLFSGKCEVYTTNQSNGVYQIVDVLSEKFLVEAGK